MSNTVVYPGSFNPPTIGHMFVIEYLSKMFDFVYVCIANNINKSIGKEHVQSQETLLQLLTLECKRFSNVHIFKDDGLIIDFANRVRANVIARGIRDANDAQAEFTFLDSMKKIHGKEFSQQYMLVPSPSELRPISSSLVREICHYRPDRKTLSSLVPPFTTNYLLSQKDKHFVIEKANFLGMRTPCYEEMLQATRYEDPANAYHNYSHIAYCLSRLNLFADYAGIPISDAFRVALVLHDARHDPKSSTNEHNTAFFISQSLPMALRKPVYELIKSTELGAVHDTFEKQLLHDIDFSILGSPPEIYEVYRRNIILEYDGIVAHDTQRLHPDFIRGRSSFLDEMMNGDNPIFYTDFFKTRYEAQAKRNMSAELAALWPGATSKKGSI